MFVGYRQEEVLQQLLGFGPTFLVDAIINPVTGDSTFDQAYGLEFFKVAGDSGLRQGQLVDEFAANTGVDFQEMLQDGDPGRVG